MKHEVVIEKHWQGKKYNVNLISWQGSEGVAFGRAFEVSKKQAEKATVTKKSAAKAKTLEKSESKVKPAKKTTATKKT